MMTIQEAADILTHRKDHWSNEIAEAEQTCVEACKILASLSTFKPACNYINNILKKEDKYNE